VGGVNRPRKKRGIFKTPGEMGRIQTGGNKQKKTKGKEALRGGHSRSANRPKRRWPGESGGELKKSAKLGRKARKTRQMAAVLKEEGGFTIAPWCFNKSNSPKGPEKIKKKKWPKDNKRSRKSTTASSSVRGAGGGGRTGNNKRGERKKNRNPEWDVKTRGKNWSSTRASTNNGNENKNGPSELVEGCKAPGQITAKTPFGQGKMGGVSSEAPVGTLNPVTVEKGSKRKPKGLFTTREQLRKSGTWFTPSPKENQKASSLEFRRKTRNKPPDPEDGLFNSKNLSGLTRPGNIPFNQPSEDRGMNGSNGGQADNYKTKISSPVPIGRG